MGQEEVAEPEVSELVIVGVVSVGVRGNAWTYSSGLSSGSEGG